MNESAKVVKDIIDGKDVLSIGIKTLRNPFPRGFPP